MLARSSLGHARRAGQYSRVSSLAQPTQDDPRALADRAAIDLGSGNIARAELLARGSLRAAENATALNVLGKIATQINRPDAALPLLRRAAELEPRNKFVHKSLAAAERLLAEHATRPPPDADRSGERYLLIRGWGYGFWADVDHVIGALLLAEITGRTPVVHWGPESLWADQTDAAAGRDAWTHYFEPVSAGTIEQVDAAVAAASTHTTESASSSRVFPPKWNSGNLRAAPPNRWEGEWSRVAPITLINRPERVVVSDFHVAVVGLLPWLPAGHRLRGADFAAAHRDLFAKYLRPRGDAPAEAEAFIRAHLPALEETVAVHVRGTDKVIESPHLLAIRGEYERRLDAMIQATPSLRIFLLTDDAVARERFEARYGERITSMDAARSGGSTGVHYLQHASRYRLGVEVLRDVLVGSRCGHLLGLGSSNVTLAALHMKAWGERAQLLDVPLHAYVSPVIFDRG